MARVQVPLRWQSESSGHSMGVGLLSAGRGDELPPQIEAVCSPDAAGLQLGSCPPTPLQMQHTLCR